MAIPRKVDFIEEVMFAEHGTRVLISDPAADRYLEEAKRRQLKEKMHEDWFTDD